MTVVYSTISGEIIGVYYDRDVFPAFVVPAAPYDVIRIDEVDPDNAKDCKAISRCLGRVNAAGLQEFYVSGSQVVRRDPWQEQIDGG